MTKTKLKTIEVPAIPEGFEDYLGDYRAVLFDSWCGEPIAWGFPIHRHLGTKKWNELSRYGSLECAYPNWYLVVKKLTVDEAVKKYGKRKDMELGPRGGFRSVTYGDKKFLSKII